MPFAMTASDLNKLAGSGFRTYVSDFDGGQNFEVRDRAILYYLNR